MCTASNAIERFNVPLRNEGFVDGSVHCQFPPRPPNSRRSPRRPTIPHDIAPEIPGVAAGLVGEERALIDFMSVAGFFAVGAGSQAAEEE